MEQRTEILTEGVGATHVGGRTIVWPIGNPSQAHVDQVISDLERRKAMEAAREQFIEDSKAMRRNMEERAQAREALERAGYDPSEVPL